MCGICGILDFNAGQVDQAVILAMTNTLVHRGPDDFGIHVDGPVGLGHTRLSIIDVSSAGHQPMLSTDHKVALTYNGEVYNFPDLKAQLERSGAKFGGHSDTEVVLRAYQTWGESSFAMLSGMFAFGLWDASLKKLFLARDHFGIKPLYYYPIDRGVVFGSEIKAVLASALLPRELDFAGMSEFLYYGTALGSNTLYKGLRKVLPGELLTISAEGIEKKAFTLQRDVAQIDAPDEVSRTHVLELLDTAVKGHLVSDVPVGVFLSGGIDSSAITALASRHYSGGLKTFSVGFDFEGGVNELPKARIVAETFNTDHAELYIEGRKLPDIIERLITAHDMPFGDAANIPLFLLSREIRGSVKVVLQGDGGDEIFGGYRRYAVLSREGAWRCLAKAGLALTAMVRGGEKFRRARRFLSALDQSDPALRMALLLTEETIEAPPSRVLARELRDLHHRHDPFTRYRECYADYSGLPAVQRMLYTDCRIILPDIFLEKVDKSTMANSLEVRVPFLDRDLATYAMGLPASQKVRKGQKKWLLRQALRGVVPDEILDAKKTGFSVPYAWWLRGPLNDYLKSVLLDPETLSWGLFDAVELEQCIHEHTQRFRNNGSLLYKLLNFVLWKRMYGVTL